MHDDAKPASIRLAATLRHSSWHNERWEAELNLPTTDSSYLITAQAPTQSKALAALAETIPAALVRLQHEPIIVIGGDDNYADCVHVIAARTWGWQVSIFRTGQRTGSWGGPDDPEQLLREVLAHVGGSPIVLR